MKEEQAKYYDEILDALKAFNEEKTPLSELDKYPQDDIDKARQYGVQKTYARYCSGPRSRT